MLLVGGWYFDHAQTSFPASYTVLVPHNQKALRIYQKKGFTAGKKVPGGVALKRI